jgi:hypothetical protein
VDNTGRKGAKGPSPWCRQHDDTGTLTASRTRGSLISSASLWALPMPALKKAPADPHSTRRTLLLAHLCAGIARSLGIDIPPRLLTEKAVK